MPLLYAEKPESPPIGTILRDANGRQLRRVIAFDPVTGEVIDWRPMSWLRWLYPGWPFRNAFWLWMHRRGVTVDGEIIRRHWFAAAPISFEVPDPPCCHRSGS